MLMGFITPLLPCPHYHLPPMYVVKVYHGGPQTLGMLLATVGIGVFLVGIFYSVAFAVPSGGGIIQVVALFSAGDVAGGLG